MESDEGGRGIMFAFRFISGVMVGIEFDPNCVVIDLFIVRIIIAKFNTEDSDD